MLKKHSQIFEAVFKISDLAIVCTAWVFSYWLRFHTSFFTLEKGIPEFVNYLKIVVFICIIWGFVFRRSGLYKPMRGTGKIGEIFKLLRSNTLSVLVLMAFAYLFWEKNLPLSRLVFVIFLVVSSICLALNRVVLRYFLREIRKKGYNLRYTLIVGSGTLARKIAARVKNRPEFGMELIGCLERGEHAFSKPSLYVTSGSNALAIHPKTKNLPIIGSYDQLPQILEAHNIDQLIVAMPLQDHDLLESLISSIGDAMVDVKIVPDVHRFIQLGSAIEEFDGLPVVSLAATPLIGTKKILKRFADIILSALFIIVSTPLMLLICLLVKLTSKGPVFFVQERLGLDGQRFNIYKFRTMKINAEAKGAKFAVANDPRTTVVGKFLRRFSLDELPQLFNVFKGQMSLVGPRPERPVFIDEFRTKIPKYMLRHKVQAGMTGWAQVNGWRGNTSIEKRIACDLYYIENWSFMLDIKILFLTIFKIIKDKNAY